MRKDNTQSLLKQHTITGITFRTFFFVIKFLSFATFLFAAISTYPELRHRVTHPRPYHSKHHHEHHLGPFFEEPLNATSGALLVGVHLATEAVLNCRVGMLKDKTVNTVIYFFPLLLLSYYFFVDNVLMFTMFFIS